MARLPGQSNLEATSLVMANGLFDWSDQRRVTLCLGLANIDISAWPASQQNLSTMHGTEQSTTGFLALLRFISAIHTVTSSRTFSGRMLLHNMPSVRIHVTDRSGCKAEYRRTANY